MRLIDADALIDSLTINPERCPGCPEMEGLEEFVNLLDSAPTADGWIQCEDEMPKRPGWYLVANEHATWVALREGKTWMSVLGMELNDVAAWQDLPKPPRKRTI